MEDNTMNQETNTQGEDMGIETEGQETEQRTFTQEEVNGFVQSRISRIKNQAAKEAKAEYEQKLQELNAREMKLLTKEHLQSRGMPSELADVISCSSEEELETKLDTLQKLYGNKEQKEKPGRFVQVGYTPSGGEFVQHDPLRSAMGLER